MKKIVYLIIINFVICLHQHPLTAQSNPCTFAKNQTVQVNISIDAKTPEPPLFDSLMVPPSVSSTELDRGRVFWWLHGLGGDENAWKPAKVAVEVGAPQFPARKLLANYNFTNTDGTVQMSVLAGDQLGKLKHEANNVLHQTKNEKSKNMLIAHSQGSIVARTMNMIAENDTTLQDFGGIVFFTGPHNGAEILRNARSTSNGGTGFGSEVISNFCAVYLNAKIKDKLTSLTSFKRFFTKRIIEGIDPAGLCTNELGVSIFQHFIDGIANETQTSSYIPGASHLNDLKNYEFSPNRTFKTERVNFYSEEPDEGYLVWRTLNYFYNPASTFEPFAANADYGLGTLKNVSDSLTKVFKVQLEYAQERYKFKCDGIRVHFFHLSACKALREEIHAWEDLIEFMQTINNQWKVIIGGKVQVKKCRVILKSGNPHYTDVFCQEFFDFPDVDYNVCPEKGAELFAVYQDTDIECGAVTSYAISPLLIWEEHKSDGVVSLESQQGTSAVSTLPAQKLYNSSHMQVRNDENTRWALYNLFEGTLPETDKPIYNTSREWFITPTN